MSNLDIALRFDEIYKSTYKAALAYITAKCKNTADIADILQETYLELYKILIKRGADYVKNDEAFVIRIAKHKVFRHYSLLERIRNVVSLNAKNEDSWSAFLLSDSEISNFTLEDYIINRALFDEARKFILTKSDSVKKVFYLYYDVDLTIPEIAKALNMSESNVKQKLYRTLKELKNLFKEGDFDEK